MRAEPKSYYDCLHSRARIQVHQGGTRSGKTFSILKVLIAWCLRYRNAGWTITIVRQTMPALRATAMRDFFAILEADDLYSETHHNKSSAQYNLAGNLVEFVSLDSPMKVRGRKRNVCFINEANELTYEAYTQLILRTTDLMILDYNPSDLFSWIYDKVIPRDDAEFYQSTYLDNPHLDPMTIAEIERLKETDENYWRIYGLGERGLNTAAIFPSFGRCDQVPAGAQLIAWGLDWGFTNDPSALVAVHRKEHELYLEELLYERGLTNTDLAARLQTLLPHRGEVVADSAEPKSIEELHRRGLNIKPARKGPDSIRLGIDIMKRHRLNVVGNSPNLTAELQNYRWRTDRDGRQINQPEPGNDHAVDAIRYVCLNKLATNHSGKYYIR